MCVTKGRCKWCGSTPVEIWVLVGPSLSAQLLTTLAVRNWTPDVQEGVYNMLMLLIELVVERLSHPPLPEKLLSNVLSMVSPRNHSFFLGWTLGPWFSVTIGTVEETGTVVAVQFGCTCGVFLHLLIAVSSR